MNFKTTKMLNTNLTVLFLACHVLQVFLCFIYYIQANDFMRCIDFTLHTMSLNPAYI